MKLWFIIFFFLIVCLPFFIVGGIIAYIAIGLIRIPRYGLSAFKGLK